MSFEVDLDERYNNIKGPRWFAVRHLGPYCSWQSFLRVFPLIFAFVIVAALLAALIFAGGCIFGDFCKMDPKTIERNPRHCDLEKCRNAARSVFGPSLELTTCESQCIVNPGTWEALRWRESHLPFSPWKTPPSSSLTFPASSFTLSNQVGRNGSEDGVFRIDVRLHVHSSEEYAFASVILACFKKGSSPSDDFVQIPKSQSGTDINFDIGNRIIHSSFFLNMTEGESFEIRFASNYATTCTKPVDVYGLSVSSVSGYLSASKIG